MGLKEEGLFWRTAHNLILGNGYRIIQFSRDQQELWLEKVENKDAQVIRLLRYDLDWSNWLKRDLEMVAANGERVRKKYLKGTLSIQNLYFSEYPPVDDYHFLMDEPFIEPIKKKTKINSLIIESSNYVQPLRMLGQLIGKPLQVDENFEMDQLEIELTRLREETLAAAHRQEEAEREVFHTAKPLITYFLLAIQIAIFLIMEVKGSSTDPSTLIEFGAKFNPLILEGEWWRFLTPIFLHIGLLHLLMNSLALYYLGPMVERIFGNSRFFVIYLAAGFTGSLASFIFSTHLSAGASGAIFGLFGALIYFGFVFPRLFFRSMGMNILIVLVINLMFGFTIPGIDNAGHIGGLIGGFMAAGIVHLPKKRKIVQQGLFLVVIMAFSIAILQYGFTHSNSVVDESSVIVLAQEYINMEEYDQAYQLLNEYNIKEQGSAELLFLLSFTEIKLNQLEKAKLHLHKVIELEEDFHEAHYNLALIYLEQKNYREAKTHAENALRLKPDNQNYQELIGHF